MKKEKIKKLYGKDANYEWSRLDKDEFHRLEFDTTMYFLKKYLPKNASKKLILDAGGGPGRYAIELAKKDYNVVLLDFVREHIELAKEKIKENNLQEKFEEVLVGDITNLSEFEDDYFDIVLCLGGALSHLPSVKERKKAISELTRVAKKRAPVFISVMGRHGALLGTLKGWPEEVKIKNHFRNFWEKGEDNMWNGGKAYAHFFTLNELENLIKEIKQLNIINHAGLEGLATPSKEEVNNLFEKNPELKKNWLEMHYKKCTERNVVDLSLHFMIIARKK